MGVKRGVFLGDPIVWTSVVVHLGVSGQTKVADGDGVGRGTVVKSFTPPGFKDKRPTPCTSPVLPLPSVGVDSSDLSPPGDLGGYKRVRLWRSDRLL